MLKVIYFILFIILFLGIPSSVSAIDLFYDDFNFIDNTKWIFDDNGGNIKVENGILKLDSNGLYFPYVLNKNKIFSNDKDYILEIKFRYPHVDYMGDGIGIGFTGIGNNFFQYQIWRGISDGFVFVYNDFNKENQGFCQNFSIANNLRDRKMIALDRSQEWNILKIEKVGRQYRVYFNDLNILNTDNNQCLIENVWFGNRVSGGSITWTSLDIDYVKVYTPSLLAIHKIILLPGLGGSWNTDAMVFGKTVADNEWKMTPFIKDYKGLIDEFKGKGLVQNQDFYVWNYDWRRPIGDIATKLDEFIDQNVGAGEKVDLIGHSLGGVVARVWGQNNSGDAKIGKIINLGSPNNGSVNAYEAWNGAKISDGPSPSSIALSILLQLQKKNFQTDVETIRNFAPVLKDLLPTFNFTKKNNSVVLAENLSYKNDFLKGKNQNFDSLDGFKSVSGIGKKTKEWLSLGDRSVFDKVLGIWPDGKIVNYLYGDGDSTVLKKTAIINQKTGYNSEVVSTHRDIVSKSINFVFSELGLGNTQPMAFENTDLSNRLVFYMGSPAGMSVKCDQEEAVFDDSGFVVIKNKSYEKCTVNLIGTGNGTYHLVLGNTDDEKSWNYFEDKISVGETRSFSVEPESGDLVLDTVTADYLYKLIKSDLEALKLQFTNSELINSALIAVDNKNESLIMDKIFEFRKKEKETIISKRVLDNVETLLVIKNKSCSLLQAKDVYMKAVTKKSLIDKMVILNYRNGKNPSMLSSVSYNAMNDLVDESKSLLNAKNYAEVMAKSTLALKYGGEI